MPINESYLAVEFCKTIEQRFATQADALKTAYEKRLQKLRAENTDAAREKQRHLESQILPGIAVYETLQSVMLKDEALPTVHGYVEQRAWKGLHSVLCLRPGVRGAQPRKSRQ